MTRRISLVVWLLLLCFLNTKVKGDDFDLNGLSFGFYNKTCPQLEKIVGDAINLASGKDPRTPAALLRLLFNDCVVQGCDASILLDTFKKKKESEMDSFNNFGIRKRELIGEIKSTVEKICPKQVSCADILVLAAREAVAISGGPKISVPLGRRDSSTAYTKIDADRLIPAINDNYGLSKGTLEGLAGGLTHEESIALLGAHTLGTSHCTTIQYRIDFPDLRNFNPKFVEKLRKICPKGSPLNDNTSLTNDGTPYKFDNKYFSNLSGGKGLLVIDADLVSDRRAIESVARFEVNEPEFFKTFASAFVKLSTSEILTGKDGVIRKQCNQLDGF